MSLYHQILTFKILPERPVISPSLGSAMVHVVTSPLPVVSIISIILGFPSVVIWKHKHRKIENVVDYPLAYKPGNFSFLLIKIPTFLSTLPLTESHKTNLKSLKFSMS